LLSLLFSFFASRHPTSTCLARVVLQYHSWILLPYAFPFANVFYPSCQLFFVKEVEEEEEEKEEEEEEEVYTHILLITSVSVVYECKYQSIVKK
jgi:hypothetical protein